MSLLDPPVTGERVERTPGAHEYRVRLLNHNFWGTI